MSSTLAVWSPQSASFLSFPAALPSSAFPKYICKMYPQDRQLPIMPWTGGREAISLEWSQSPAGKNFRPAGSTSGVSKGARLHTCFVYRVSCAKANTFRIAQHDVCISKMSFLRTFINNWDLIDMLLTELPATNKTRKQRERPLPSNVTLWKMISVWAGIDLHILEPSAPGELFSAPYK